MAIPTMYSASIPEDWKGDRGRPIDEEAGPTSTEDGTVPRAPCTRPEAGAELSPAEVDLGECLDILGDYVLGKTVTEEIMRLRERLAVLRYRREERLRSAGKGG